jgi:hypothetical protein
MQPYRELGNELDKNYDHERLLSTSTGRSGSSGIITERISAILLRDGSEGVWEGLSSCGFGKGRGLARMAEQTFFSPPMYPRRVFFSLVR